MTIFVLCFVQVGCSSNRYKYIPFSGNGEHQSMNGKSSVANDGIVPYPVENESGSKVCL